MTPLAVGRALVVFSRPRQWPILTAQLAVGFLLAQPSGTDLAGLAAPGAVAVAAGAWLAWVVLLNGGTLAYNSAWDRDTDAVAFLRQPPPPPPRLAAWALAVMAGGVAVGWAAVGAVFGILVAVCVALSVLYSHPGARWKSRPGLDLVVNMAGYGAGTTWAGLLAGRAATGAAAGADEPWLIAGFGLLFGSLYPTTQIYQIREDRTRGDATLTTALGIRPALGLALVLGAAGTGSLLAAAGDGAGRGLTAVAGLAWLVHLAVWLVGAERWDAAEHERGMYRALLLWAVVDAAVVAAHYA
jgi:hypothetical protein